jgi:hypothetical protein
VSAPCQRPSSKEPCTSVRCVVEESTYWQGVKARALWAAIGAGITTLVMWWLLGGSLWWLSVSALIIFLIAALLPYRTSEEGRR